MKTESAALACVLASLGGSADAFSGAFFGGRAAAVRAPAAASTTPMRMKLAADDFIPSETWMAEYMNEQGLRYSMGKTKQEIETEGDYTILEKLFGQTSNNAAKIALKKAVREKVKKVPEAEKEQSAMWLEKYGYQRYFPAYVDNSGEGSDAPAAPVAQAKKAAPAGPSGPAFSLPLPTPSKPAATPAVKAAPKPAPKPAAKAAPMPARAKPSAVKAPPKKSTPKVQAAKPAAAPKPKPAPVARKVKVAPAAKGNLKNLPKKV